jgi:hypothetical protein
MARITKFSQENNNNCLDREKQIQVNDLDMLKDLLQEGRYVMEGIHYSTNDTFSGEATLTHTSNSIKYSSCMVHIDGSTMESEETHSIDSTYRVYTYSSTKGTNTKGRYFMATKQLKLISIQKNKAQLSGYGSSTSTEKFHCGANIEKVIKLLDNNSFRIETTLDGKKAYDITYKRRFE